MFGLNPNRPEEMLYLFSFVKIKAKTCASLKRIIAKLK
jgi:hypothetical protein